jgi:DNA-directed RNA polymerase subunit alpha
MTTINCIENYIDKERNHYGSFLIEPLDIGQGITLGNALRRTLLSDLTGFSIIGVRINNTKHEFQTIGSVREDILEILLNLKEIVFKEYSFRGKSANETKKLQAFLAIKGPKIITAGMLQLPENQIKILNPNQYICTLVTTDEFYLEIDIEKGKGYRLADENRKRKIKEYLSPLKPSTLFIDSIFMPIKKVNYKIKLISDTKGNIKESLNLEILTNGSISPRRSIQDSLKILMNLFYPLFSPNNIIESEYKARKEKRILHLKKLIKLQIFKNAEKLKKLEKNN